MTVASPSSAAARRVPTLAPNNSVIDGPSPAIVGLDGMSIARDGSGGLVYTKDVGGVAHVFVSVLVNGSYQAPIQVDAGLPGPSSQPVIAAGQAGLLLVGFINAGALYIAQRTTVAAPLSAPSLVYAGAANPSLSLSNFGKAYLAFTATSGAGGGDVRTAFYYQGRWALEPSPLDANPADAAGTGSGRPDVIAAGDGVGIVVWGENGHIYSRRVTGTTPSVVDEQADVPSLGGWPEVSAGDPEISTGGDSSYASVTFQEELANGAGRQSRVLMNRLHGSQYDGIGQGDGIAVGGPEGADQPETAMTEYGEGFATSEHDQTHELFATTLGSNDSFGATERVDSLTNGSAPDAVPAAAGLVSTFIAWQQTPGVAGLPEIRVRYAPDGFDLGPEEVVSSPAFGPTDADAGLAAGGDVSGDAAIAWTQGTTASRSIVAAQLYQTPGGFVPAHSFSYSTSARPLLAWSGAAELWGPPQYVVRLDGVPIAQTTALQAFAPAPVRDGRHTYQVTAVNQAGLSTAATPATVFVDTVPPRASFKLTGVRIPHGRLRLTVTDSDPAPRGLPGFDASGVATVTVAWGDGHQATVHRRTAVHAYTRRRTYRVTVTVTDKAGNRTVLSHRLQIKRKPKPKKKRTHKPPRGKTRTGHAATWRSGTEGRP